MSDIIESAELDQPDRFNDENKKTVDDDGDVEYGEDDAEHGDDDAELEWAVSWRGRGKNKV